MNVNNCKQTPNAGETHLSSFFGQTLTLSLLGGLNSSTITIDLLLQHIANNARQHWVLELTEKFTVNNESDKMKTQFKN
jgi:hypothetical protein